MPSVVDTGILHRLTDTSIPLVQRVQAFMEGMQSAMCSELEKLDGEKTFGADAWKREGGGGGLTRVLEGGAVFEKAGVNSSTVFGTLPDSLARKMNTKAERFRATGISLVLHPRSPMVPTVHANFRYLEMDDKDAWFGGGADLTPSYLFEEDVVHFHKTLKDACDKHDISYYPRFKKWCDEYFHIPHRGECRGVGGLFFDYLRGSLESDFMFVRSVAESFLDAYLPIVQKRVNEPWDEPERRWQLLRRGRYVEFNLVYDRGTVFGLETRGRTESVLMSLPPLAKWDYNVKPAEGSREATLVDVLQNPREWVA
jgi:coproporphyrinogen III oxidase